MKRDAACESSVAASWVVRDAVLSLARPLIMGIVNVTPDSFADGGRHATQAAALSHALRLIDDGADIIDIGGESTRPRAIEVTAEEELRRVVPLIESLVGHGAPISVDTSKPEVMQAAIRAGAAIVNDVNALRAPGAEDIVAETGCGAVVMHMQGRPRTMQDAPHYDDVVAEVEGFLAERVGALRARGVAHDRIAIDPGFGFGKTVEHNFKLLRELPRFAALGCPLLVGFSRKSMLGAVTGRAVDDRVIASVAAAVLAAERGARILRVHDVAATRDGLRVLDAMQRRGGEE